MEEHIVIQDGKSVVETVSRVTQKIDIEGFAQRVGGSSASLVQGTIYFAIGFVVGALSKRYFKFFFMLFLSLFLILKWFEHAEVIVIHWDALSALIGVESGHDLNYYVKLFFDTLKQNVVTTLLLTGGFLFGNKAS